MPRCARRAPHDSRGARGPPGRDRAARRRLGAAHVAARRRGAPGAAAPGGVQCQRRRRSARRPMPVYLAMAALLTLVTASITLPGQAAGHDPGRRRARGPRRSGGEPVRTRHRAFVGGVGAGRPTRAFAAVSEQHFERSKLVILGLATKNPQTSSSSDWAYERQLAGSLLNDTRLYKQAAEERGLGALARRDVRSGARAAADLARRSAGRRDARSIAAPDSQAGSRVEDGRRSSGRQVSGVSRVPVRKVERV